MAGFSPSEPRVGAGSAAGGQWGGGGSAPAPAPAKKAPAKKAAAKKAPAQHKAAAHHKAKGKGAAAAAPATGAGSLHDAFLAKSQADRVAFAKGASSADLEKLSQALYGYRSVDPNVVKARVAVANELAHRGIDVKNYGAKGGGLNSRPAPGRSAPAPMRRATPAAHRTLARAKAAAPAPTHLATNAGGTRARAM